MSELVEFIRGCLDADEQTARAAGGLAWHVTYDGCALEDSEHEQVAPVIWDGCGTHAARHDPARVLAEVNAKRAILDKYERASAAFEQSVNPATSAAVMALAEVVEALAQCFRGEPGWRDEWGTQ